MSQQSQQNKNLVEQCEKMSRQLVKLNEERTEIRCQAVMSFVDRYGPNDPILLTQAERFCDSMRSTK